jgi:predicted MFS family arabinose efflux permease
MRVLFAVACGLAVANVYYYQPLLRVMGDDLGMSPGTVGVVGTATQVGYALGLLLIVPLGDLVDRRKLAVGQMLLSAGALAAVATASTETVLLISMAAVGALAVVAQVLVAYAAGLAEPKDRGRTVGVVTSGIIVGILLARTVSGTLADVAGWRSVYVVSAGAGVVVAGLLLKAPKDSPKDRISYPRLIRSVFRLYVEEPVLRTRAVLALLIFGAFTMLATPMVLPLSAPPYDLSTTQVGLFGLAGAVGALGASRAGRQADRGYAQRTIGVGLALMAVSWVAVAFLPVTLWALVVGVVVIDFGLQSVHVSNQSLLFEVRPEARSRLTAGYMVFYSIGSATGAILSTVVYAHAGWTGVCVVGGAISLVAVVFWALTRRTSQERCSPRPSAADATPSCVD